LLSETPVDVNFVESDGATVLHFAARNNCNFSILRLLLDGDQNNESDVNKKGAMPSIERTDEINQRTPLADAVVHGNIDFIRELLSQLDDEKRRKLVNDQDIMKGNLSSY